MSSAAHTPEFPVRHLRPLRLAAAALIAAPLAGCGWLGPPLQPRGNRVDAREMGKLVPGKTTETEAQALLGSPTAKGTFDPNVWLYVGQMTRPQIGATNHVASQDVVRLQFNQQGVLVAARRLSQKNALSAPMVARATPTPGTETTFLQRLFGNIGNYNPGFGQQSTSPAGGAPLMQ